MPKAKLKRKLKPVESLWVCRGPAGYLGKAGVNLSLTASADLIHASPFVTRDEAEADAGRANRILGITFRPELRAITELVPKKEKPSM